MVEGYLAIPDLPAKFRAVIERLAGNESMETFWRDLPARIQGREQDVIAWAAEAYTEATSLQPPPKVQQKKINEFLQVHAPITDPALLAEYKDLVNKAWPPLTYGMIAYQARWLGESLDEIRSVGRQQWAAAWPGDPKLSFDRLRSILDAIAACCDCLDADAQEIRTTKNLPEPPRKRGGHTAQQVYFDIILKARFRTEFRQPYAAVVATLEQVAFDLPEAVDESTVLKR
jgi:hypothetical protein